MRKTKIIGTLGPATDNEETLRALLLAGMDVARLNFSHGAPAEQARRIETLRRLREELNLPVAILGDTKGPEIRTGTFLGGQAELIEGQAFTLTARELEGSAAAVSISFKDLPKDIAPGTRILIDDGLVELVAERVDDTDIICRVVNGGTLGNHKSINVPGARIAMPYISSADRADLRFAVQNGCDFIAASFTRCAQDIRLLREELARLGGTDIWVIAKIENAEGVNNIDEILDAADGIMVARGDLGVEVPLEQVPALQKLLIKKAYQAGKQVITATQMLESMIHHPRPTRAEATDVANAIYDGTSAIMLSGETAMGSYPVEAVAMMDRIARRTEADIDYKKRFGEYTGHHYNVTDAISHATCAAAHDLDARAIVTVTLSGTTARMISRYRPAVGILACTASARVARQLNLSWGVAPFVIGMESSSDALFTRAVELLQSHGMLCEGDLVVITAGVPLGMSGTTNMLRVHVAGESC
ncbi:MAG: pyruvate kinase [Oscillospiraceae bacterium]|jgi:pyruvate kinase|nr:pyruvate kinase [Oscillospiraceae bacterium]